MLPLGTFQFHLSNTFQMFHKCVCWLQCSKIDPDLEMFLKCSHSFLDTLAPSVKILISCVRVIDNRAVVIQGCEQLAATAAMCLLRTIPYLLRVDLKSRILKDMVQQYNVTGSFHPRLISGTSLSATRSTGPTTFPLA